MAYDTKRGAVCTLDDLHAQQAEFPHCIPDGIFVLREDVAPGEDIAKVIGADDHVVEFEITNNRTDCYSIIGIAREAAATFNQPFTLHEPEVKGSDAGNIFDKLEVEVEALTDEVESVAEDLSDVETMVLRIGRMRTTRTPAAAVAAAPLLDDGRFL